MSVEDVSRILRHKNSVVTAAVYVHEIKSAEQMRRRADLLEAMSRGRTVRAANGSKGQQMSKPVDAKVAGLREVRDARQ